MSKDKPAYADQFATLDLQEILKCAKNEGLWPFPDNVQWLDWENGDNIVTGPILKDVEELEVAALVPRSIVERLEAQHMAISGKPVPWSISICATIMLNNRVFYSGDPAGRAILYAVVRDKAEGQAGLAVAVFPTTVGEWKSYANAMQEAGTPIENTQWKEPGFSQSDTHPVVCVSYLDVLKYLEWRNTLQGNLTVGAPSEPDWLYAATKGDGRTFPWGEQSPEGAIGEELLQWSGYEQKSGTSSVHAHWRGQSPFGIHDMSGNVWEWTSTEHKG